MQVLVTGGAGYIGSHTALALAAAGHTPVVYDNLRQGHAWAVQWGPLVEGDLRDTARLEQALRDHQIEAVLHFAALIAVGESVAEPRRYFDNNVAGTLSLLTAMEQAGVRDLVFSSTAAVYGDPLRLPIDEDHPKSPVSPYGDSKWMVERMLDWTARTGRIRYAALRYFNACGGDPEGRTGEVHHPETHLIPLIFESMLNENLPLKVFGGDFATVDGTPVRDYVHVLDLAAAHVAAVEYLARGGASFAANLGTGSGFTVRQVIAAAEAVTGRAARLVEAPRRDGDATELVADSTRARTLLGWSPRHSSLKEIVTTAWRWRTEFGRIHFH